MIELLKNKRFIFELAFVLSLCFFPLCYRINTLPLRQWDESRNAVNAIEMLRNHHYLVRYFDGQPETWEVKPPLLVWLQLLSMKIFGLNQFAIRFPTILATFSTVLLLILYFKNYQQNRYIGYLASLILVTSQGYINWHIARTGDHDALLILLETACILIFYEFLIAEKHGKSTLIFIGILFVLGMLLKSVAILFILPGLFLSTILFKSFRKLFLNAGLYLGIAIFVVACLSYYLTREKVQPGYLKAVWEWELFDRFLNTDKKFHSGTFWEYAIYFYKARYTWWIWFLPASIILMPFLEKKRTALFYYITLNAAAFFMVISLGSKGGWYDGPLYPLFAMIIAIFLYRGMEFLVGKICHDDPLMIRRWTLLLLVPLFILPGIRIIKKVSNTREEPWDNERFALGYFLREDRNVKQLGESEIQVLYSEYFAHFLFYMDAINLEKGKNILTLSSLNKIKKGDKVLISEKATLDSIARKHTYDVLLDRSPVVLLKIRDD